MSWLFWVIYPLLLFGLIGAGWAITTLVSRNRNISFGYLAGWLLTIVGGLLFLGTVALICWGAEGGSIGTVFRGLGIGLFCVWMGRSWIAHNPKQLIIDPTAEGCMGAVEEEEVSDAKIRSR